MIHFASEGPKFSVSLLSGTWMPQTFFFFFFPQPAFISLHFKTLHFLWSSSLQFHQQRNEFFKNGSSNFPSTTLRNVLEQQLEGLGIPCRPSCAPVPHDGGGCTSPSLGCEQWEGVLRHPLAPQPLGSALDGFNEAEHREGDVNWSKWLMKPGAKPRRFQIKPHTARDKGRIVAGLDSFKSGGPNALRGNREGRCSVVT